MTTTLPDNEAFAAGQISFMVGAIENPYHPLNEFDEHREWQRGFNNAYFKQLKQLSQNKQVL